MHLYLSHFLRLFFSVWIVNEWFPAIEAKSDLVQPISAPKKYLYFAKKTMTVDHSILHQNLAWPNDLDLLTCVYNKLFCDCVQVTLNSDLT